MEDIELFFGNSILHDMELSTLEVDYSNGTILFQCIDEKKVRKSYLINKFISIQFEKKEEWGIGKYIASSDIASKGAIWDIEIQLNSGDICRITCCK